MEKDSCIMVSNKDKYRCLCENEESICIFSKAYWMDAVCGEDNWDVLLTEQDGKIVGALVYYFIRSGKKLLICQPPFTQSNGVWMKYPSNQKYEKRLSYEKKIMNELIEQLEQKPLISYKQCFNVSITNWLPFYWKGYHQTTNYSYRIMDISDVEVVMQDFSSAKRKNIRRAQKENIKVKFDLSAQEFYAHHKEMLKLEGKTISYSYELFQRIYKASYANDSGRVLYTTDEMNQMQAALFVVWDEHCAFELISIIYPQFRNSGALTLLTLEAIKMLSGRVKAFDMEGSMIEQVENSFRQFGTRQLPYFVISKQFVSDTQVFLDKVIRRIGRLITGD